MTFLVCAECGEEYIAGLALAHSCPSKAELVLERRRLKTENERLRAANDELLKVCTDLEDAIVDITTTTREAVETAHRGVRHARRLGNGDAPIGSALLSEGDADG